MITFISPVSDPYFKQVGQKPPKSIGPSAIFLETMWLDLKRPDKILVNKRKLTDDDDRVIHFLRSHNNSSPLSMFILTVFCSDCSCFLCHWNYVLSDFA